MNHSEDDEMRRLVEAEEDAALAVRAADQVIDTVLASVSEATLLVHRDTDGARLATYAMYVERVSKDLGANGDGDWTIFALSVAGRAIDRLALAGIKAGDL